MKPSYQLLWLPYLSSLLSHGLAARPVHALQSNQPLLLLADEHTEMPPKQQGMTRNPTGFQALVLPWAAITQTFLQCPGKGQGQGNPQGTL